MRPVPVPSGAAKGGAFSCHGSIVFCGSLPHAGFSNAASPLLHDVVTRFSPESPP